MPDHGSGRTCSLRWVVAALCLLMLTSCNGATEQTSPDPMSSGTAGDNPTTVESTASRPTAGLSSTDSPNTESADPSSSGGQKNMDAQQEQVATFDPAKFPLENFDKLFQGDPGEIEHRLTRLLPRAESQSDPSIHVQILSQLALAQAMQQRFREAHDTLDRATALVHEEDFLGRSRVLLERGRVFHQAGEEEKAIPLFQEAYDIARRGKHEYHAINAAHMIAIVVANPEDRNRWNRQAIAMSENAAEPQAKQWLSALYNNLGQGQIKTRDFEAALRSFERCQTLAEERGEDIVIRGAVWGRARAMRGLGRNEEALDIQNALRLEYQQIAERNEMPQVLLNVGLGLVYEELAELLLTIPQSRDTSDAVTSSHAAPRSAADFASKALEKLESDAWFRRLEPERLERLREIQAAKRE